MVEGPQTAVEGRQRMAYLVVGPASWRVVAALY